MIKKASAKEYIRMGWNKNFHPGSDLNQILGEILEMVPKKIYNLLHPRIIRYDKEFPYAITESNHATTGKNILKLFKCKKN